MEKFQRISFLLLALTITSCLGWAATDLLWHNSSTGETQIWHMDGHRVSGRATVLGENGSAAFVGLPWSIVGTNERFPRISDVRVRPDTRDVIISFTSTQKAPPLIEIGKVAPAPDQHGILAFPAGSGAFSRFVPRQDGNYSLNLGTLGEQLDIGTTYYYIINVFNDNKNNTKRPREQVTGKFTTLPQTVKVIFTDLRILPELLNLTSLIGTKYVFFFDVNVDYTTLGRHFKGRWPQSINYEPGRSQLGTADMPFKPAVGKHSIQGEEIVIENSPDDLLIVVQGIQDYGYHPPWGVVETGRFWNLR